MKYHRDGSHPRPGQIFVFGSNLDGIHGGGAAFVAHNFYGAQMGVAIGMTGSCYAIPTVHKNFAGALPLSEINEHVNTFLLHAIANPEIQYLVTRIGCGIAGHSDSDVAPMFVGAPDNCSLPDLWRAFVEVPA